MGDEPVLNARAPPGTGAGVAGRPRNFFFARRGTAPGDAPRPPAEVTTEAGQVSLRPMPPTAQIVDGSSRAAPGSGRHSVM